MKNHLQHAIDSLRSERDMLLSQLERIDSAIASLDGKPSRAKSSRSSKPCCTKQEVIEIIEGLLRDNGQLTVTELEGLAKEKLSNELNKSLSGFAMRFKEAIREPKFVSNDSETYRLVNDAE